MGTIRIVNIIPYRILPAKMGGEKGISLFNEYLGKLVPIVAIGTKNNEIREAHNYTFRNILPNSRLRYLNPLLFFPVRKVVREEKATHLMTEHPYYGWLLWLISRVTGVKTIIHSHNIEFERSRTIGRRWWPLLKWYERWVYGFADLVFFISDDDKHFAIEELGIDPHKCHTATYGVEIDHMPEDREICRQKILQRYSLTSDTKLLLFNGTLSVISNIEAVQIILEKINPALMQLPIPYRILLCGKGLPDHFNELKDYQDKNILYAGFVDDIAEYFKAADIFLNPIISGAGIKTKAVEAIAYGCTVVSTELGALGMDRRACCSKLEVSKDNDWLAFSEAVSEQLLEEKKITTKEFYRKYYWGTITENISKSLLKALSDQTQ